MTVSSRVLQWSEVGVAGAREILEQASRFRGVVLVAGVHQCVAVGERGPGLVVAAEVFQFLVAREFDRRVLVAARLHALQRAGRAGQVIVRRGLFAQARQFLPGATVSRVAAYGFEELGFGFADAAGEDELDAAPETEFGAIRALGAGSIVQRQRLRGLVQQIAVFGHLDQRGYRPHRGACRVIQAIPRGNRLSATNQRRDDGDDDSRIGWHDVRGRARVACGIAHAIVFPSYVAEDQMCRGMVGVVLGERFERGPRRVEIAFGQIALGAVPVAFGGCVHAGRAQRSAQRAASRSTGAVKGLDGIARTARAPGSGRSRARDPRAAAVCRWTTDSARRR